MKFLAVRPDLGVRGLLPQWKAMLSRAGLKEDLVAGLTVACVAIPLSLAIALASGVPPATGLITAIVAGIVCALFGGTPLAVSGPAAAMAVLIASVVERQGAGGLLVVVLICGALQLASGALGLGRLIRLVPLPVVEGFTAGIGAIILIGQLPRMLGLPPPQESHVFDVLTHIGSLLSQARAAPVALSVSTLALMLVLPRLNRRIPAALVGVVVATAAVAAFGLQVETIGAIPSSLPMPSLPAMPTTGWSSLLLGGFMVYALASLETLLSSSAVDKLSRSQRHDPDQELIGQGLGNVVAALFGGLAATGVIARSALNVQAGARTRRSAIFHSIALLGAIYLASPLLARIPVAALAGVLFAVAIRMINVMKIRALWRVSRGDAVVYLTTFIAIVFIDLIEGVQWGLVAALAIAAVKLGRSQASATPTGDGEPSRFALSGPVTFLSSLKLERLGEELAQVPSGTGVVLDMSDVTAMDASGADMLSDLASRMHARGVPVAVFGLREGLLKQLSDSELLPLVAPSWQDALARVSDGKAVVGEQRLLVGVQAYRRHKLPSYAALFERLSESQSPHTLFITCSDSRIQPSLITSTDPGELFIVRNVGNMVSPCSTEHASSTGAAIEYAVGVLGVSEIVVCGHARCGAISALREPDSIPSELNVLRAWVRRAKSGTMVAQLPTTLHADEVSRLNALRQLDNLRSYPVVEAAVREGKLRLHAWFFEVGTGEIEAWDVEHGDWTLLAPASRRPSPSVPSAAHPAPPKHGQPHPDRASEPSAPLGGRLAGSRS